jgi:Na+/proline symporter
MLIDGLIVAAFIVYSVTNGLLARRKASRNLSEYFLAGRTLKGWKAGTSMAATQFAADTPLAFTGLIAVAGVFALWRFWIYGLAFLLMAFVFSALWRRARVLTDAELTERRYSGGAVLTLRSLKAVYYGTVINCAVLALVLKATVVITEVFLPWHAWLPAPVFEPFEGLVGSTGVVVASGLTGIGDVTATANNFISVAVILVFVTFYSMTGGLRSVVATDLLQFTLAIIGTVAYAWLAIDHAGGFGGLSERLVAAYPASGYGSIDGVGDLSGDALLSFAPSGLDVLGPFLVIISLQWFFQVNADGTGYLAQRSMACQTDRQARIAGVVFAFLQILLRTIPWLLIGLALLLIHPFTPDEVAADPGGFTAGREFLFVSTVNEVMPAGLRGLLLVGMLAALASTLDTHMNWGASYWSNDLYDRLLCRRVLNREARDSELVLVARLSSLALILIAFAIVPLLESIQEAWKLSLLFGAGVGAVLVLRWLWERINVWSEVVSIVASLALAPILLSQIADERDWLRLLLMSAGSTVAAVAAALLTPPTSADKLDAFFREVQPPGFWRRTARRVAPDARPIATLGRLLRLVGLAAVTLFGSLYGVSRLLIAHPDVHWAAPVAALAVALAAAPFWLPSLFDDRRHPTDDHRQTGQSSDERGGPKTGVATHS